MYVEEEVVESPITLPPAYVTSHPFAELSQAGQTVTAVVHDVNFVLHRGLVAASFNGVAAQARVQQNGSMAFAFLDDPACSGCFAQIAQLVAGGTASKSIFLLLNSTAGQDFLLVSEFHLPAAAPLSYHLDISQDWLNFSLSGALDQQCNGKVSALLQFSDKKNISLGAENLSSTNFSLNMFNVVNQQGTRHRVTAREFDLMYAMFLYTGNITLYCYTQQSRI